ncbi:MAG: hypothetical protein HRT55_18860 [Colwellia sp.]|uniref:hypothetical protein n=1 Tax=Colwellia sp. TaxID=56799 RepID=UPI0025C1A322|nr:hypothetical protein [Colwellia sp.]NQZ28364.1 hypothetical protein [Colwellia sp.]
MHKIYAKLALLVEVSLAQTSGITVIRSFVLAMLSNVLKKHISHHQAGRRPCFFKSIDQI